MNEDLARADAFERRLMERLSTETVPFHGGLAYLDAEYPFRYDSNLLWVSDAGAAPVERWIEQADEILGSRGYAHRKILIQDQEAASRLEMGFVEHGYGVDRGVVMTWREEPEREPDPTEVEEVSFAQARAFIETSTRRQPWAGDEEVVRQLSDHPGKLEAQIGARFFAARVDGQIVGCCEMYRQGHEAQIEAVETLEEHRGRGLATAFVLAAARAAQEAGATWVFLWADAEDWPRQWYRRLGFVEGSHAADFTRPSPEDAAAKAAAKSPGSP